LTAVVGRRSGIGEFAYHMAASVTEHVDASGFMISMRGRQQLRALLPPGVSHLDRVLPARPLMAAWERWYRPDLRYLFRGFDVVHGTNFVVPPIGGIGRVVTVHDLTPLLSPRFCRSDVLAFPTLVRHAIRSGAYVHTPSAFVRAQVLDYFGADPSMVVAIAHGITPLPEGTSVTSAISSRLAGRPFVLALSTLEPRKGLIYLVKAFASISAKNPDLRLVLTGQAGWGIDELLGQLREPSLNDRVILAGYVSEDDRAWLLRNALVFAYPSLYEGFGLPPLEAMSVGTPVVSTLGGAIPEVVGPAAVLVAPGAIDELADALVEVMDSPSKRASLIELGYQRASQYSWETNGQEMAKLYAQVARR